LSNPPTAIDPEVLSELLLFAHALADASRAATLPHFRRRIEVTNKAALGRFDPVTEADRGAEAVMRQRITARFPDHGIAGEEFPDRMANGPFNWILDPVDGTRGFICGLPLWGTLIGLSHDGAPLLGMMDQPYTGERFWGVPGDARFRRAGAEETLRVRRCAALADAVLACTTPEMFTAEEFARFDALASATRMVRFGGDCYLYCMLAMGFIDIVAEAGLKPFDIAPLMPIVAAAGGVVTTWDGGDPRQGGRILASGDPAVHEAALKLLAM
jgi:myo-inositol-1(or 4)-monophosphatase